MKNKMEDQQNKIELAGQIIDKLLPDDEEFANESSTFVRFSMVCLKCCIFMCMFSIILLLIILIFIERGALDEIVNAFNELKRGKLVQNLNSTALLLQNE